MAKKQTGLENLFKKTEQPNQTEQPEDPVKAIGIGLRQSEWDRLAEIAKAMGRKRHELAVWALRDFLRRYEAGEIQTENRPSLPGM